MAQPCDQARGAVLAGYAGQRVLGGVAATALPGLLLGLQAALALDGFGHVGGGGAGVAKRRA